MLESAPSHQLADIISAIVNATFKEKLDVLNSVNLKDRYVCTMTFDFFEPLHRINFSRVNTKEGFNNKTIERCCPGPF